MAACKNIHLFLISLVVSCVTHAQPINHAALSCQQSKLAGMPPPYPNAENRRSDTMNILKYTISLEIGTTSNNVIAGSTDVRFVPKIAGQNHIRLDLLKLVIDSVRESNTPLSYVYNDTVVRVNFTASKGTTDTSVIRIYYHGTPKIDATGWGGFYFDNAQSAQYAFNLGVGFGANPHNYGRVWFPCFDNFVERSRYEFNIVCDSTRRSYCNGQLVSDVVSGTKRTRKWVLTEEIPTYLACVAVANYRQINWTVSTLTGPKPIVLAAHSTDTSSVKVGFANLPTCVQGFENYFGPYKWNKVGYSFVPFNSGAMEHATNITYPRSAAGSLVFEDLMAHELAHHWWGNLITCETPEDMWINEGWATFSAYMFYEWKYGKASYLSHVKNEHATLIHQLHKQEGGFRPVSGLPHSLTYSNHVYKKGADIAHTLRGYLGDSAFFAACKYVLAQKSFQSINSNEFRDLLQTGSGQSLASFFNDWVYNGGWSHFAIDSVSYVPQGSSYTAIVCIRQKTYGAPALHSNVPLEISLFNSNWSREVRRVTMSGAAGVFTLPVTYQPVYCALNYDSRIGDATSHEYKQIKANGVSSFVLAKATLTVTDKGADSSLIRIIHNFAAPDPIKSNPGNHNLSRQHYWKVEGIFSAGFTAKMRLSYDGNKNFNTANGYLDTLLVKTNGDSLALFYRRDARDDWQWLAKAKKVKSSARIGYFEVDSLMAGEYAFANLGDTTTSGFRLPIQGEGIRVFPNPASHTCRIEFGSRGNADYQLTFFSVNGRLVLSRRIAGNADVDLNSLAAGVYTLQVRAGGEVVHYQKMIVE
jgi:hypothetical protein